jgi:ADP-ribosylglycohydrolase
MSSRIRGAYYGSLVADALSLATHYEYDAIKIKKYYGILDRYYAPGEKTGGQTHGIGWGARNYHGGNGRGPAKKAGEQTDYGDYNILLLEHLANTAQNPHRIKLSELIPTWQQRMKTWRAWMCTMTKTTLQQVQQGVPHSQLGGYSNAMAVRYAAAFGYYETEADVVHAARTAMFTHRETSALDGGEFFARVTFRVLHKGLTPREAIEEVAQTSSPFIQQKVKQALDKVREATDPARSLSQEEFVDDLALTSMARLWDVGKTEPIKVGKASPTEGTLPGSIYFIVKYEGDLVGACIANAMVGGDSASRAVAIGMVMGAHQGVEGIPKSLGKGKLVEWERSEKLLDRLPLLKSDAKDEL